MMHSICQSQMAGLFLYSQIVIQYLYFDQSECYSISKQIGVLYVVYVSLRSYYIFLYIL